MKKCSDFNIVSRPSTEPFLRPSSWTKLKVGSLAVPVEESSRDALDGDALVMDSAGSFNSCEAAMDGADCTGIGAAATMSVIGRGLVEGRVWLCFFR